MISSRRRILILLVLSGVITIVCIGLSLGLAFRYVIRGLQYRISFDAAGGTEKPLDVDLITRFSAIDIVAGKLVTDWFADVDPCDVKKNETPRIVDVLVYHPFLAVEIQRNFDFSFNDTLAQIFQFQSCSEPDIVLEPSFQIVWRLDSEVLIRKTKSQLGPDLQSYPFDTYGAQMLLYFRDNATKEGVHIEDAESLTRAGTPVTFKIELYNTTRVHPFNNRDALYIPVRISRSQSVKTLVVAVLIINWLVTLSFLFIALASMLWSEFIVREMVVAPFATVFALVSIRQVLPGAPPGFGATIDYFGLLPNLVFITLAGCIVLFSVLAQRIKKGSD